jgi:hypothetical protein
MAMSRSRMAVLLLLSVIAVVALSTWGVRQRIKRRRLDKEHEVEVESAELLAWLDRQGGYSSKVRIQNFDHGGEAVRGLGAAEAIPKGTGFGLLPQACCRKLFAHASPCPERREPTCLHRVDEG